MEEKVNLTHFLLISLYDNTYRKLYEIFKQIPAEK